MRYKLEVLPAGCDFENVSSLIAHLERKVTGCDYTANPITPRDGEWGIVVKAFDHKAVAKVAKACEEWEAITNNGLRHA